MLSLEAIDQFFETKMFILDTRGFHPSWHYVVEPNFHEVRDSSFLNAFFNGGILEGTYLPTKIQLPPGWSKGRYFIQVETRNIDNNKVYTWAEVTPHVEINSSKAECSYSPLQIQYWDVKQKIYCFVYRGDTFDKYKTHVAREKDALILVDSLTRYVAAIGDAKATGKTE